MDNNKNPLKRLAGLLALDKHEISSIYFYSILSGLIQLSVPIGVQAIIGFVMGASMVTSIYVLVVLVVLGVFIVGVLQMNQMKIIEKIQQNIFLRYAFEFADKIPQFNLSKTDKYYLPEKVNRFFDTISLQKGISKLLLDIPTASVQIIFGLLLLALYHPLFIMFDILLVVVLYLILKLTSQKGFATSIEKSNYKYEVATWLQDLARMVKSMKLNFGSNFNLLKTDKSVTGYLNASTKHFKILMFQYKTLVAFKVIITTAMLTVGTYLLIEQQINIGEFIAAEIVILTLIGATEKLIGSLDTIYDVLTGLEKLASVTELPLDKKGTIELVADTNGLTIDIENYSISYGKNEKLITNLNAHFDAESIVCINGYEGLGKTSLLKSISGINNAFNGSILINNVSISNYTTESYRSKIGMYLQSPDLFLGTLTENIILGRTGIAGQDIINLAKELNMLGAINKLDNGIDTVIDPAGKKLGSSFVKQILILRSLINSPKLILLDEPFIGLDVVAIEKLNSYLFSNKNKATIFVVCNDDNFAKKCNYQIQIQKESITVIKN